MIALDSGDKIRGDSTSATEVDYTIFGLAASARKQLADGQLPAAIGDLYTAGAADTVLSIILVNTGAAHNHVNLYLTPSGGTARRLIAKDLQLEPGYSLHFSGAEVLIVSPSGGAVTAINAPAATAESDFIVADASPFAWIKKTLAQVKTLILNGVALVGGANTFNLTNGTASLDVAPGVAVNVDHNLTTGGACTVGGAAVNPTLPAFLATRSATVINETGNGRVATVVFDNEIYDLAANYATGTGIFTAPVTGKYHFRATVTMVDITAAMNLAELRLVTSNRSYRIFTDMTGAGANPFTARVLTGGGDADLDAADTAYVTVTLYNGAGDTADVQGDASPVTIFSGHLVG